MFRTGYISIIFSFVIGGISCSVEDFSLMEDRQEIAADSLLSINWDLYNAHLASSPDSALYYMEKVRDVAESAAKPKWIAGAAWGIADLQNEKGLLGEAILNYLKASTFFKEKGELYKLANVYMSIGNVYAKADNYATAFSYFTQAKDIFIYEGSSLDKTRIFRNLSICYTKLGKYKEAYEQLLQAEKLAYKAKDFSSLSLIYNSFGEIYLKQNNFTKAQDFYRLTIQYADSLENSVWHKSLGCNNLGEVCFLIGRNVQAKEWLKKAVFYGEQAQYEPVLVQSSRNLLAKILIEEENYPEAIAILEEGLEKFGPEVVNKTISESLALINDGLFKINEEADPLEFPSLNKRLIAYNLKLVDYNSRAAGLDGRLEIISQQQAIQAAVDLHAYDEQLILAEKRTAKMKYLVMIPLFLLICALISVYIVFRRNRHYKRLYSNIEQVLNKSKVLRHLHKS